jgi:hypothetical protein
MKLCIFTSTLFFISFILGCCSKKEFSQDKIQDKLQSLKITSTDTVKVKYDGLTLLLSDVRNDKLLFFDYFKLDVIVTDLKGTILSGFNNAFIGAEDVGNNLYGTCFQSDSTIAVLSNRGYYIYSLDGKLITRYLHSFTLYNGVYMTGDFTLEYDNTRKMFVSLLTTSTDLLANKPGFYEQVRHLTVFKTDSQNYKFKIPYDPGSSYLQKEYYTPGFFAHFGIDNSNVAMVYDRDPIVYIYDLDNFRKIKSFNTYPDNFNQVVKFKFGTEVDNNTRLTAYANSSFGKIFIKGDTVITTYGSGIPIEVFEGINNLDDYNNVAYKSQHFYLQMFINGRKKIQDFELPREYPYLSSMSNNKIFLTEQMKWQNKNDGYKRYLICQFEYDSL